MKTLTGVIVSLKNQKTAMVDVDRLAVHPLYKKAVKRNKKYACHIEDIKVELGDTVTISECRPISKTKFFKVVSKVDKK